MAQYSIFDANHAEGFGVFATEDDAWAELERLASIPSDAEPNRPPCICGRRRYVLEYDPRTDVQRAEHGRAIERLVEAGRPGFADFHAVQELSDRADADGRRVTPALEVGPSGTRWLVSR